MDQTITNAAKRIISINFKGVPWLLIFTMLLTTLKCFGKFDYSWVWVFAPLWGPLAALLGIIAALIAIAALGFLATMTFIGICWLGGWVYEHASYPFRRWFGEKGGAK